MKRIKNVLSLAVISAMVAFTPSNAASATTSSIDGTNLERVQEEVNKVDIAVDKFNYETKSFQLELAIEGDVKLKEFTWSDALSSNDIKKNYIYDESSNTIKIYVTSKKNLVEFSKLEVGTLEVEGEMDTTFNIKSNGVFKYIYSNKNKEGKIDALVSNNEDTFNFVENKNPVDPEEPGNGEEGTNPTPPTDGEDGEGQTPPTGGDSGNGDIDNPESGKGDNEEQGGEDSKSDTNQSSKPIKTGDVVGAVAGISLLSLGGVFIFRKRK